MNDLAYVQLVWYAIKNCFAPNNKRKMKIRQRFATKSPLISLFCEACGHIEFDQKIRNAILEFNKELRFYEVDINDYIK